jgi:hypothetical protein
MAAISAAAIGRPRPVPAAMAPSRLMRRGQPTSTGAAPSLLGVAKCN